MTTNEGLATPSGSVAHGKFGVRHNANDDGLGIGSGAAENSLAAATTIRSRQDQFAFGAASPEPADRAAASIASEISFGPFCLRPAQRLLFEAGKLVPIGGRGLELLIALVERAGELVMKDELIVRVWPNVSVCESNLKTQIAALRAALRDGRDGARYVVSIPGRGYCFVAPIARSAAPEPVTQPTASLGGPIKPPFHSARLIGRAAIVHELLRRLQGHRFVTVVGPGGIGKTAVVSAVAEALEVSRNFSVCFVDLTRLSDSSQVMGSVASALGGATNPDGAIEPLVELLRGRQILIVLDGCDRVVDGAAVLAERILEGSPDVHILATSREALRAEGEAIYRLPALAAPPDIDGLTAIEALTFPAVQLFVEHVAGNIDDFELSEADAPVVAEICRSLDGLPLAIELAAGHVEAFGARGLAAVLGHRFRLLMRGRRTAPQRHRTLGATLGWSYETLSEPERVVLRRLSVFAGAFTLNAACAIATDAAMPSGEIVEIVASLVGKSLLQADVNSLSSCYRLLETTRLYIQEKLADSGEMPDVARRHAEHIRSHSESSIADVRAFN